MCKRAEKISQIVLFIGKINKSYNTGGVNGKSQEYRANSLLCVGRNGTSVQFMGSSTSKNRCASGP